MNLIITQQQQTELLKAQAVNRLSRADLGKKLCLSSVTLRKVLDTPAPLVVNQATYTAVNNYLIEQLSHK